MRRPALAAQRRCRFGEERGDKMTAGGRELPILPNQAVWMNQVKEHLTRYLWRAKQAAQHEEKLRGRPRSCGKRNLCNTVSIRRKRIKHPPYASSSVVGNPTQHCGWKRAKNSLAIISAEHRHCNPLCGTNDRENLVYHASSNTNPTLTRRHCHRRAVPRPNTPRALSVLDAPGAPLNTTSDIINSKLNDGLRGQSAPSYGFSYMEERLGLHRTSAGTEELHKHIGCRPESKDSDGDLPTRTGEEFADCDLVHPPSEQHGIGSGSLAERIRNQEQQIGRVKEDSMALKERMACVEHELLGLKLRLGLLENGKTGRPEQGDSCSVTC